MPSNYALQNIAGQRPALPDLKFPMKMSINPNFKQMLFSVIAKSGAQKAVLLILTVIFRLSTLLLVGKILASRFGPEAFGVISQIMGVASIFYMFAGGGLSTGLVTHISRARTNTSRSKWLSSAIFIALGSAIFLLLLAVAAYKFVPNALFEGNAPSEIILFIGVVQIVVGFGNISIYFLSGSGEVSRYALSNIIGSAVTLFLVYFLTLGASEDAGMYVAAALPLATSLMAVIYIFTIHSKSFRFRLSMKKTKRLLSYSLAMMLSSAAVPAAQIFLRKEVSLSLDWSAVGYWQVVARLSDAYMQIFGALLINFLLPQMSSRQRSERAKYLFKISCVFAMLFLAGAATLLYLRDAVITLAFSVEYLPAAELIPMQLLGDFARICALLLVCYFLAEGRVWIQGLSDSFQAAATVGYFLLLTQSTLGLGATVLAHAAACISLLVLLAGIFWMSHRAQNETAYAMHNVRPRSRK